MFENFGELAKLMQKAKDIKSNMAAMKQELAAAEYGAQSADGQVVATVSGDFRVKSICIAPGAPEDRAELALLTVEAVNAALDRARADMQKRMNEATGGVKLPDIF